MLLAMHEEIWAKAPICWVATTHFQPGFCRACARRRRLSNEYPARSGANPPRRSMRPTLRVTTTRPGYRLQEAEFPGARVATITDHDVIEDINAKEHAGGDQTTRQCHVVRTGCGIAARMHVREDDRGGIAE